MVIWIIGLSGTGKTTLATQVVARIRQMNHKVVLLDGDLIRDLFGNDVDHTIEGRRRNADRLSVLTKFLSDQGIHVVAAVLSIFVTIFTSVAKLTLGTPRVRDLTNHTFAAIFSMW